MSAIDITFHWCRQPSAINGLQTTYVSKRGSDTTGDGTAQNPYASIAKATSVATTNTNIMLDDGEWNEDRTANNKAFNWWGNGKTIVENANILNAYNSTGQKGTSANFLIFSPNPNVYIYTPIFVNCIVVIRKDERSYFGVYLYNSIAINYQGGGYGIVGIVTNSIVISPSSSAYNELKNSIIISNTYASISTNNGCKNCNFTNGIIPNGADDNCINDTITGQTLADYFNYVHPNLLANTSNASIEDWLKCDFTAKAGSKNIGAGEKGTTIGLNQGFTMYADNSANDVFKESNGATLKNIDWDSNLNGYVLVQKERVCQGATSTTITLDSSASAVDDYYNNLFVGIVGGDGYGEMFLITDYNGTTHTATIDGTWTITPTTSSVYTISGTIQSATKDFGKVIKVKRNWLFADMTPLNDGRWSGFLTHVTSDGKQFPVNSYSYEYSIDGTNWYQGETDYDLISATDGENKVYNNVYGDCSSDFNEEEARRIIMRYIKMTIHIGFNIGEEDVE